MSDDISTIHGHRIRAVEKLDYSWFFTVSDEIRVVTESEWRLVMGGKVFTSSEDHEQKFGLPKPVDAVAEVLSKIENLAIQTADIDESTGDLFLRFSPRDYLQFLQLSSGYESWRLFLKGTGLICGGGGEII